MHEVHSDNNVTINYRYYYTVVARVGSGWVGFLGVVSQVDEDAVLRVCERVIVTYIKAKFKMLKKSTGKDVLFSVHLGHFDRLTSPSRRRAIRFSKGQRNNGHEGI